MGVDIFFVISGYLITSIILPPIKNKKFSIKNFYLRRIKRILPALFFVFLVSIFPAFVYFLPEDLENFFKSILSSSFFVSNFYFDFIGNKYNADNSKMIPMLHTWSLSIEEQFYIFYPFLLLIMMKIKKFHPSNIILVLLIFSFIYANYFSSYDQASSFYSTISRSWELLAGALIFTLKDFKLVISEKLKSFLVNFSVVLIFICLFLFDESTYHPSYFTSIPIIATCTVIFFAQRNFLAIQILSNRIFTSIGLISYSLYLWHYPIISFRYISKDFLLANDKFVILALTLLMASVSYFLIEKPFRHNKKFKIQYIFMIFMILMCVIIAGIFNNGYPSRSPEIILNSKQKLFKDEFINYGCNDDPNPFNCSIQGSSTNNVYLVGDSHAGSLAFPLFEVFSRLNWNYHLSTYDNCALIVNYGLSNYKDNIDFCNKEFSDMRFEYLLKANPGYVIFFETFYSLTDDIENKKIIEKNFSLIVNRLISLGHKIVVVYPVPKFDYHVPRKIFNLYKNNKNNLNESLKDESLQLKFIDFKRDFNNVYDYLDKHQAENIIRIYPEDAICNSEFCLPFSEENLYYKDDHHLSYQGSKLIVDQILKAIKYSKN